ncbi:Hypothetical predicted protein [Marmota monax]|uniref:Uncharacterized protein n=1 Tax=Marmota monax TaxID=9995 RepID=A0A5E4C1D1_MARMO|nr:Hypothetical predicted protein [Marmota monax]
MKLFYPPNSPMSEFSEQQQKTLSPQGKNPQHKIEYRHSTLTDEDNDDVGQPNESDLNDSFIDDEEEEYEPTDEDSDWEPGKEDQEKEDVEELLKEAKKFMKRKK